MSAVEAVLARLDGVKRTGKARWIARCPGHDDRRPSLAISETADGRVLLHCFGGCSARDVLSACGLDFDALFPERPTDHRVPRERRPFNASDVLQCIAFEALLTAVAAANIARGCSLSSADTERVSLACSRLHAAAEVACHA